MLNKKLLIFIYFQVIHFLKLSHRPLNKINTFNFYLIIPCNVWVISIIRPHVWELIRGILSHQSSVSGLSRATLSSNFFQEKTRFTGFK